MSALIAKELKGKKALHPNSRKTLAIAKKVKKMANRQKAKTVTLIKQSLIGEKMMWIKEHMVPDVCPYTPELTAELLEKYIARNDEEMEQISIKHSVGGRRNRQHASREDTIRLTKERELEEYNTCGIEIPDILTPTQCEMLRKWTGELRFLPNFKFRRFGKKHLQLASKPLKDSSNVPAMSVKSRSIEKSESINDIADTTEDDKPDESAMEIEPQT